MTKIFFADCEGDNFLEDISKLWTIQVAVDENAEVEVFADQPGYKSLKEGAELLSTCDKVVMHHGFGFDLWAINKFFPGTLNRYQVIDSVVISRLMDSTAKRHSLADLGEALGFPKGDFHDFDQFSEAMVKYGIQDVRILQEAWKGRKKVRSFGKFYDDYREACDLEFQTAYIIEQQKQHGFRFDYEKAQLLETEFRVEQKELEDKLQKIFPPIIHERWSEKTGKRLKDKVEPFNPGSRQQIAKRLIDRYGWKPIDKTPTGEAKIDETILGNLEYPEAKEMARYLTLGKKLGMISDGKNAWLKMAKPYPNGKFYIHGAVNPLGARTHRMSHFLPNVAQADGDPRMRSLWLPDEGHYQIGVDAEGLELRELAHFLHPYDGGKYAEGVHNGDKNKGTDVHTLNRIAAELFLRDSAKTMIYAHNYGCFDKKLGLIVFKDLKKVIEALEAEEPTENQRKVIKEVDGRVDLAGAKCMWTNLGSPSATGARLRESIQKGITGLGELIGKCKRTHNKFKAMPGHDQRWIPSASDHSALNTLLQGNGSIVMKKALVLFEDELEKLQLKDQVFYCANVHDEFQLSVHPDLVKYHGDDDKGKPIYSSVIAELGKESITKAGETLEVRCPLAGSADIGHSWADTH